MARSHRIAVQDAWAAYKAQPALIERLDAQEQELGTLKQHNRVLADAVNQAIGQRDDWMGKAAEYLSLLTQLKKRTWLQRLLNQGN